MTEYALEHGVPSHEDMATRLAAARTRLAGVAHVTPVLTSRQLDEACGASVFSQLSNSPYLPQRWKRPSTAGTMRTTLSV